MQGVQKIVRLFCYNNFEVITMKNNFEFVLKEAELGNSQAMKKIIYFYEENGDHDKLIIDSEEVLTTLMKEMLPIIYNDLRKNQNI